MKFFLFFCGFALMFFSIFGLDEDGAKERRCIAATTTPNLNYEWMQSIPVWYFPLWSKLELYRIASDMLEMPVGDIPFSLWDKGVCVTTDKNLVATGFNTTVTYDLSVDATGAIRFKAPYKYAKAGTHVITITNNKSFILGITCWEDDEASYGIWTTEPQLPVDDKETIVKHLQELGFDMKFMVETPYDKCNLDKSDARNEL